MTESAARAPIRSSRRSAPAAWARSIARATRKLGRDVAIKVLPRAFAADPERLARFEREARMLAALNHPHIGAIYGLEEADGVAGAGPRARRGRDAGGAPRAAARCRSHEALAIARQIAEALEAAHEKGIVHRDLKPANIASCTPRRRRVKVLDFGLAKAMARRVCAARPDAVADGARSTEREARA